MNERKEEEGKGARRGAPPAAGWLAAALCALACAFWPLASWSAGAPQGVQRAIMAGDRLRISVAEAPDMNRTYPVAGDGTIDFVLAGRVLVAETTREEAAERIRVLLEEQYFKKATVKVEIAEFVEGNIMVLGEVKAPGIIPFKGDEIMTLMEAIVQCQGLGPNANGREVRILRWKPGGGIERQVLTVDVQKMLESLNFEDDQFLRPRDIIVVSSIGTGSSAGEFLALGAVGRPGFHPAPGQLDVIRAVTQAGGLASHAQMDAARLLRPTSDGEYQVVNLDLYRLFSMADTSMNIPVKAGDILFVPSQEQATSGRVYLLGEVSKPGMIGISLSTEVTLARTLLTVGFTQYADKDSVRIVRSAPDGSKQTLTVNVGKILKTGSFEDDVPLRNEDVIIVPEKIFLL
jgi:protein involved in polysaccharide export with SLBB domain